MSNIQNIIGHADDMDLGAMILQLLGPEQVPLWSFSFEGTLHASPPFPHVMSTMPQQNDFGEMPLNHEENSFAS